MTLEVHAHGPKEWALAVNDAEPAEDLQGMVTEDVQTLLKQATNTPTACGMFCTHYPYMKEQIANAFVDQGVTEIPLISQGELVAEALIEKIKADIARMLEAEEIHAYKPGEERETEARDISIFSMFPSAKKVTPTKEERKTAEAAVEAQVRKLVKALHPNLPNHIDYNPHMPEPGLKSSQIKALRSAALGEEVLETQR